MTHCSTCVEIKINRTQRSLSILYDGCVKAVRNGHDHVGRTHDYVQSKGRYYEKYNENGRLQRN